MHWWTVQQLRSKRALTRLQAVAKLADEGTPRALEGLESVINEDEDANVRKGALQAAARIKDERTLSVVTNGLRDSNHEVRETAVRTLQRLGDAQAISALVTALEDPHATVRWSAAKALDALGWKPSGDTQCLLRSVALQEFTKVTSMGAAAVEPLITSLKDPNHPNRRAVVEALSQTGDARIIKPLVTALKDNDAHVRVATVEALGRIRDARSLEPLTLALKDRDHLVRAATAAALSGFDDAKAVPPLIATLKDQNWNVRQSVAEALGRLKDPSAVEPLLPLLKDKDHDVRASTIEALAELRDARAVTALVEALADSQTAVRQVAAGALRKIDPNWARSEAAQRAVPALKTALQSPEYWVRHSATETLDIINAQPTQEPAAVGGLDDTVQIRRRSVQDLFIGVLSDYDRDLRLAAVEALGRLGDSRAAAALTVSLQDEDDWVRAAAEAALERLGRPHPQSQA
jgi:HEAT repeat protein